MNNYKKINRCNWVNLNNKKYVTYHDNEWCVPCFDDKKIFEYFTLEVFQAGLSYEIILNKKENFRNAFDNFNYQKIATYNINDISRLLNDKSIIRNKRKIIATINNAKAFIKIIKSYNSFSNYIWSFTKGIIYETGKSHSDLSDIISKDLKHHSFSSIGSTTCYSFLQAIGIINSHENNCFKNKKKST